MPRAVLAVVAIAALVVLAGGGPAWAHEEINPSTFPTGKPVFLALNAANEKPVDMTSVILNAPAGVPFGEATRQPAGWTVDRSGDKIAWSGGRVPPAGFEQWGFEIEGADQPGPLAYKMTLGFADGSSDDVEVDVTAVAAGQTTPTVVPTGGTPTTPLAPASTNAARSEAGGSDSGTGLATAALVVAIVAGVLAVVALVAGARRGKRPAAAGTGDGDAEGGSQDW